MPSKLQTVQLSTSKAELGPVNNMKANNRVEKWLHSDLTLAIGGGEPQGKKPSTHGLEGWAVTKIEMRKISCPSWESNYYLSVVQH
jgi:hypothetical protein